MRTMTPSRMPVFPYLTQQEIAAAVAAELRAVGISMNLAPVLDVHSNPENRVIGDRALHVLRP